MPEQAGCLDIAGDSACRLSEPGDSRYIGTIEFSHACIDLYTNTHPAHTRSFASSNFYSNFYSYTIANVHTGAGWLPEATGRLHTYRSGWHDDQPAHACDVDTRS